MVARASALKTAVKREQSARKASIKGLKPSHSGIRSTRTRKLRIRA